MNFVQLIVRTILWFNPLRVFMPMGITFILAGFALLLLTWKFLPKAMDATFAVLTMTGVTILAMGMLADLIDKRLNRTDSKRE